MTDLKHRISKKVVQVKVADVARLQLAPRELPNSGESGYPKVRHGVANQGFSASRLFEKSERKTGLQTSKLNPKRASVRAIGLATKLAELVAMTTEFVVSKLLFDY